MLGKGQAMKKQILGVIPALILSSWTHSAVAADCSLVKPVEVMVDGQKQIRYDVKDGELLGCLPAQPKVTWTVNKDRWSDQDEINWQNFVTQIGRARQEGRCSTVDTCLASSANPYRDDFDVKAFHFSDCADFPMYLRAYFAFKNQLPFSFAIGLKSNPPTLEQIEQMDQNITRLQQAVDNGYMQALPPEEQAKLQKKLDDAILEKDKFINQQQKPQTADNGNQANSRYSVVNSAGVARDFFTVVRQINNQVSSGNYRMLLTPPDSVLPDFYPTKVSRQAIRTGTTVYNPEGHVGMVYEIKPDGLVMVMDAGINSDVKVYSFKSSDFPRSRPQHAGQFKNWRPQYVENAKYDKKGNIVSGKTVMMPNEQILDFSLEQYFGNVDLNNSDSKQARWVVNGKNVNYYTYVEEKLAERGFAFNPVDRIAQSTTDLCNLLQSRAKAINSVVSHGINLKDHPAMLPENPYSTSGEWESYAVNSKDVNIRAGALLIMSSAKDYLSKYASGDPRISYSGDNLKRDMIKAFISKSASCQVQYTNSNNKVISMPMSVALKRLTKMSATPYFCTEKIWGATFSAEARTCNDDSLKQDWYKTTQFLRNATNKDLGAWGGASLDELRTMATQGKLDMRDRSAEFDILKRLSEL